MRACAGSHGIAAKWTATFIGRGQSKGGRLKLNFFVCFYFSFVIEKDVLHTMYSDYALPLPKFLPDLPHNALKIKHYWESNGMKSSINVPRTGPTCLSCGLWKAI